MNLAEFVEEALSEMLAGIRNAQKKDGGQEIAAEMFEDASRFGVVGSGKEIFTIVQFDVSISAETKGGGKAGLRVWSIGAEGSGEHTAQHTNRVKFSVPLRLPSEASHRAATILTGKLNIPQMPKAGN